jgi:3-oxoacyl-[acyl-carrier protein] reductase
MTNILVTGASGGIGAAICKALAVRGVTVVLHYQSDRAAAEAEASHGGRRPHYHPSRP